MLFASSFLPLLFLWVLLLEYSLVVVVRVLIHVLIRVLIRVRVVPHANNNGRAIPVRVKVVPVRESWNVKAFAKGVIFSIATLIRHDAMIACGVGVNSFRTGNLIFLVSAFEQVIDISNLQQFMMLSNNQQSAPFSTVRYNWKIGYGKI